MSYWLPKLEAAGLPTPRTIMIPMPDEAYRDVFRVFDGDAMLGDAEPFFAALKTAAADIGYPVFLRTGLTSAKHSWARACYVADAVHIPDHVATIVEFSELCDIMGLPCDWWAVREFLPTIPLATCSHYDDMPVCREFRVFVNGAQVRCWHSYWPAEALEIGGIANAEDIAAELAKVDDIGPLLALASRAGTAVGGAWSVDLLETKRGWYITDMAEAEKSWHWPDCVADASQR
jgi:hypothetical protein